MTSSARAVVAALPVVAAFGLIATQRVAAWKAATVGALVAIALAISVWSFPWPSTAAAVGYGVATGLYPIVYIVWASLLLYNLTVVTGWAERLRESLAHLAGDRELLLLLIGFGFAAFLDSTAGFLTPVTVGVALLVGLGVPALDAAAYTLVASSLPPIFGAMAIPLLVMADVAHVPVEPLAARQAAVAAVLFLAFPSWLTATFGGWTALRRLWLPSLAAGVAYAAALFWTATRVSPYPAALAASLAALAAIVATGGRIRSMARTQAAGRWRAAVPWWPYWVLMVAVVVWSVPVVARELGRLTVTVRIPHLERVGWRLDVLASPATGILVATALVALLGRASAAQVRSAVVLSARQVRYPLVNILAMFVLAQVMNVSGMTQDLGESVAASSRLFPLVSPFLSWLGAGIAGSNTASNALLGRLQALTATHLGLDPILVLAFAGAAAPLGKMIAPQVIAAAAGAANLKGAEGRLLRTGLFHSLVWAAAIGIGGLVLAGR